MKLKNCEMVRFTEAVVEFYNDTPLPFPASFAIGSNLKRILPHVRAYEQKQSDLLSSPADESIPASQYHNAQASKLFELDNTEIEVDIDFIHPNLLADVSVVPRHAFALGFMLKQ